MRGDNALVFSSQAEFLRRIAFLEALRKSFSGIPVAFSRIFLSSFVGSSLSSFRTCLICSCRNVSFFAMAYLRLPLFLKMAVMAGLSLLAYLC